MTVPDNSIFQEAAKRAAASEECREDIRKFGVALSRVAAMQHAILFTFFDLYEIEGVPLSETEEKIYVVLKPMIQTLNDSGTEFKKRALPYLLPASLQYRAFIQVMEFILSPPLRPEMFLYDLCLKAEMGAIAGESFLGALRLLFAPRRLRGKPMFLILWGCSLLPETKRWKSLG
jgi:hypothetical protein